MYYLVNVNRYVKKNIFENIFFYSIVNNMEWYKGIGVIDFMNNIGRQFRMGTMLSRESVKVRLAGSGMSFTEFTYQAFQAYDWLHLFQTYKCLFQVNVPIISLKFIKYVIL